MYLPHLFKCGFADKREIFTTQEQGFEVLEYRSMAIASRFSTEIKV